jgi:hypothetical protein
MNDKFAVSKSVDVKPADHAFYQTDENLRLVFIHRSSRRVRRGSIIVHA